MTIYYVASNVLGTQGYINEQAAIASTYRAYASVGKTDGKQTHVYFCIEVNEENQNTEAVLKWWHGGGIEGAILDRVVRKDLPEEVQRTAS